ncbi:MAG: hypothetical protein R3C03_04510 [Pirellulaceae bacterium]
MANIKKKSTFWIVVSLLALVIVPMAVLNGARIPENWKVASAYSRYQHGDQAAAIDALQKVAANPKSHISTSLLLSQWLWEQKRPTEALEVLDRVSPKDGVPLPKTSSVSRARIRELYLMRFQVLQSLGRFDDALSELRKHLNTFDPEDRNSMEFVNQRAFMTSLVTTDLIEQQRDMRTLLQGLGNEPFGNLTGGLSFRTRAIASIGLLAAQTDIDGELQRDVSQMLDEEIEYLQLKVESRDSSPWESLLNDLSKQFPETSKLLNDMSSVRSEQNVEKVKQEIGLLCLVNAYWLESIGRDAEVAELRRRVFDLGIHEDEWLAGLPDGEALLAECNRVRFFGDTYGWIRFRQGIVNEAFEYLNMAVASSMLIQRIDEANTFKQSRKAMDWEQYLKFSRQSHGALLKHRVEILDALKRPAAAEQDRKRIQELGFDLDSPLLL